MTTNNTLKRQTAFLPTGFETATPASKRPQIYVLNSAATIIAIYLSYEHLFYPPKLQKNYGTKARINYIQPPI
jgi:hypothetical protein